MQTTGPKNRWLGLVAICISLLVISLDNTVVNVALPSISKELGASASELQWIVDAYVLVFAALLLTMGSISDRIGRKRSLQFGIAWFGVFSLGAALSNSTGMLIAMRALLGIGGAIIMPSTLSLITSSFSTPKNARRRLPSGRRSSGWASAWVRPSAAGCSNSTTGARCFTSTCRSS